MATRVRALRESAESSEGELWTGLETEDPEEQEEEEEEEEKKGRKWLWFALLLLLFGSAALVVSQMLRDPQTPPQPEVGTGAEGVAPTASSETPLPPPVAITYLEGALDLEWIKTRTSKQLIALDVSGAEMDDAGLAELLKLTPDIQELYFASKSYYGRAPDVTDAGMVHLASLSSLREISIPRTISAAGFEQIAKVQTLESVELKFYPSMDPKILAHMHSLPRLRKLKLSNTFIQEPAFAALKGHSNLSDLQISSSRLKGDEFIKFFASFPKMETLDLSRCSGYTSQGLAYLEKMPALRDLIVPKTFSPEEIQTVAEFPNIEMLRLTDLNGITKESVAFLARRPNLRVSLRIPYQREGVPDGTLALIGKLTNLVELDLYRNEYKTSDFQHLLNLPSLRKLSLYYATKNAKAFSIICKLTTLEDLSYSESFLYTYSATTFEQLTQLSNLKRLSLRGGRIKTDILPVIAKLPALESLTLFELPISSENIGFFGENSKLRALSLRKTWLHDAAVPHLLRLPRLENLDIWDTVVTPSGLEQIKKGLPNCNISYGNSQRYGKNLMPEKTKVVELPIEGTLGQLEYLFHEWNDTWFRFGPLDNRVVIPLDRRVRLSVNPESITNLAALAEVDKHNFLTDIDFPNTRKVNNEILAALPSLPGIKSLNLDHTGISDAALIILAEKFPNAKNLSLLGAKISDAALDTLQGNPPEFIDLRNTPITMARAAEFKMAHPNTILSFNIPKDWNSAKALVQRRASGHPLADKRVFLFYDSHPAGRLFTREFNAPEKKWKFSGDTEGLIAVERDRELRLQTEIKDMRDFKFFEPDSLTELKLTNRYGMRGDKWTDDLACLSKLQVLKTARIGTFIKHISKLKELRILNLQGDAKTHRSLLLKDEDIILLSGMHSLEEMNLSNTAVFLLKNIDSYTFNSLRLLRLEETEVSDKTAQEIANAFDACEVILSETRRFTRKTPEIVHRTTEGSTIPQTAKPSTVSSRGGSSTPKLGKNELAVMLPGDVPLVLVRIPKGSFQMGAPVVERSREGDEGPVHTVDIGYDFYMGKFEVTQAQWLAVMGSWPEAVPDATKGKGDNYPAYFISWDDIAGSGGFIEKLNQHIAATNQGAATFRLPSEAEWEYSCRAGTQTRFFFGDSLDADDKKTDGPAGTLPGNRSDYMWFGGNEISTNREKGMVGVKLPNQFGLHDMSGSVQEWCGDFYHSNYKGAPIDGASWNTPLAEKRVRRGGSRSRPAQWMRSASRRPSPPHSRSGGTGFRLARTQN